MQEQNFEKQVQQKMEELSFVPSEPVWQKVEEQIQKKKDRRRLIFWVLPFLLLGGGYFALYWNSNTAANKSSSHQTVDVVKEKENSSANNPQPDVVPDKPIETTTQHVSQSASPKNQQAAQTVAEKPKEVVASSKRSITTKHIISKRTPGVSKNQPTDLAYSDTRKTNQTQISKKTSELSSDESNTFNNQDNNTVNVPVAPIEKETSAQEQKDKPEGTIDIVSKDSIASSTIEPTAEKKDTIASIADSNAIVQAKTIQLKKKWLISFKAAVGAATVSDELNPFGAIVSEEKSASDLYSNPIPQSAANVNFNSASNAVVTLPASPVYKSWSYSAGLDIRKKLTKRLSLVTGLQYNYFSTWQYVGKKMNNATASRNNFSTPTNPSDFYLNSSLSQSKYTTKYHLLSVPFGIDYQLSKSKPLHLSVGAEVAQLLSTNALYYDRGAAVYYERNGLFRKTQLFGTMAVTYRLIDSKLTALYVGPQAQFGFSNLLAQKSNGTQHLISAGISTRFVF